MGGAAVGKEAIGVRISVEAERFGAADAGGGDAGEEIGLGVELVMALEEEFGTEIPDDDVTNLKTVQNAVDYIKSKQG